MMIFAEFLVSRIERMIFPWSQQPSDAGVPVSQETPR